jgi:DNA-binding transcriptional regulator YiaG
MATKKAAKRRTTAPRKAAGPKADGFVAKVRKEWALSRREFARLTGYSERAIVNWERGRTPDEPALRRIKEIHRFRTRLSQVVKPEYIAEWLSTPNDEFDGLKPLEVVERGEMDRLWEMLFYLESGSPS